MDTKFVPPRTFGQWLQHQLDRRDWSKADFARRMGVKNADVSRWTRDERKPRPDTVDRIADALGVDLDVALAVAGYRPADVDLDPESATARLMPLIEQVDWSAYPGRLEDVEGYFWNMIHMDEKRRSNKL